MCGIAGIWGEVPNKTTSESLGRMLRAMRNRGPDGARIQTFAGGGLGVVRLALVDVTQNGMQPFLSADGRVALVFNGEMYNHSAERERLRAAGHQFRSGSDTEVVLSLYLERGERFVERMRGMFALAIADWREAPQGGLPKLILARDPFGMKPLYVSDAGGRLVFASQLNALA